MIGHGTTLVGSVTGAIGNLTNIDWDGITSEDVENTDFDSPKKIQTFEGGLIDPGTLAADLNFSAALKETILAAVIRNTNETWTITLPSGDASTYTGRLKSMGMAIPMRDKMTMPIAIKFSGEPSFSSSSSSSFSSSTSAGG